MQHVDLGATLTSAREMPRNGACALCEMRVNWGRRCAALCLPGRGAAALRPARRPAVAVSAVGTVQAVPERHRADRHAAGHRPGRLDVGPDVRPHRFLPRRVHQHLALEPDESVDRAVAAGEAARADRCEVGAASGAVMAASDWMRRLPAQLARTPDPSATDIGDVACCGLTVPAIRRQSVRATAAVRQVGGIPSQARMYYHEVDK